MTLVHAEVERALAEIPDVTVGRAWIASDGQYLDGRRHIDVRHGIRGAKYFCTLLHEAIHGRRRDRPIADPVLAARQELVVSQEVAWRMIPIRALGEAAAAYPHDYACVADELEVDIETLRVRMAHLHPSERHYLKRRLEHTEESA